ncbi:MAG: hypothetical protein ACLRM8_06640 [Alistipes sp.]
MSGRWRATRREPADETHRNPERRPVILTGDFNSEPDRRGGPCSVLRYAKAIRQRRELIGASRFRQIPEAERPRWIISS